MSPSALEVLQSANVIETLVELLKSGLPRAHATVSVTCSGSSPTVVMSLAGNGQPDRQHSLQPLSLVSDSSRGSCLRRRDSCPDQTGQEQLTFKAIRITCSLRLCASKSLVQKNAVAGQRIVFLRRSARGPLLEHICFGKHLCLVSQPFNS